MAVSNKPESKPSLSIWNNGTVGSTCWSCGDMRAAAFCQGCGKVQPPLPTDYFSFFGLPRRLNLDLPALERDFYQLSRKLHPDLNARMTHQEQEWSLQQSSLLNDAYRTLKDPIQRTEYLLGLEGVHIEEQSKTATDAARKAGEQKKQVVPPELLEEVFELNMELEEARTHKKTGDGDPGLVRELEVTKKSLEGKFEGLFEELKGYWGQWDALISREESGNAVSAEERKAVRDWMVDLLNRRSYIRNLVRDVNEVLES